MRGTKASEIRPLIQTHDIPGCIKSQWNLIAINGAGLAMAAVFFATGASCISMIVMSFSFEVLQGLFSIEIIKAHA